MRIELDDPRCEPGGRLPVRLRWDPAAPREGLELRLVWFTRGRGNEDLGFTSRLRVEPSPSGERSLELELPRGPWSWSGALISIAWRLELESLPDGEAVAADLVLAPGGTEVRPSP